MRSSFIISTGFWTGISAGFGGKGIVNLCIGGRFLVVLGGTIFVSDVVCKKLLVDVHRSDGIHPLIPKGKEYGFCF